MNKPLRYIIFTVGFLFPLWKWGMAVVLGLFTTLGGALVMLFHAEIDWLGRFWMMAACLVVALIPLSGAFGLWAVGEIGRKNYMDMSQKRLKVIFVGMLFGCMSAGYILFVRQDMSPNDSALAFSVGSSYSLSLVAPMLISAYCLPLLFKRIWIIKE